MSKKDKLLQAVIDLLGRRRSAFKPYAIAVKPLGDSAASRVHSRSVRTREVAAGSREATALPLRATRRTSLEQLAAGTGRRSSAATSANGSFAAASSNARARGMCLETSADQIVAVLQKAPIRHIRDITQFCDLSIIVDSLPHLERHHRPRVLVSLRGQRLAHGPHSQVAPLAEPANSDSASRLQRFGNMIDDKVARQGAWRCRIGSATSTSASTLTAAGGARRVPSLQKPWPRVPFLRKTSRKLQPVGGRGHRQFRPGGRRDGSLDAGLSQLRRARRTGSRENQLDAKSLG